MGIPPERRRLGSDTSVEFLCPELLPPAVLPAAGVKDASDPDSLASYISETVLQNLPNDLTRMVYLASLRDCNSGVYLHPELSQQKGVDAADRALRVCHEQVFRRLLTTRLPEYVTQLQEYIRYTRGETLTVLKTWRSLQAYRATVPLGALPISSDLFVLNVGIALEILGRQIPELQHS
jgi:hypothetical protein